MDIAETEDRVTVLRKGLATVGDEITMAETETAPLNVSLSLSPTELFSNPGASIQQNSSKPPFPRYIVLSDSLL